MKRFAILKLGGLIELKTFEHEDEWKEAMRALAGRQKTFLAFKWHHGASIWQQTEVVA